MPRRATPLALLLMLFTTALALAQSPAEFGRSSGEPIEFSFKTPSRFSGSLGLTTRRSTFGSFGGTLVKDRVWFFASGERRQSNPRLDSNLFASLGDRNSIAVTTVPAPDSVRTFLSMRYTGIVSSNSFFTATVSSGQK
jgi:hypothetical protein